MKVGLISRVDFPPVALPASPAAAVPTEPLKALEGLSARRADKANGPAFGFDGGCSQGSGRGRRPYFATAASWAITSALRPSLKQNLGQRPATIFCGLQSSGPNGGKISSNENPRR
jgi:hypothetical protein